MRIAKDKDGNTHTIHAWYLIKNGWEYFQTKKTDRHGYSYGFVHGFADEWGSFSLAEIGPSLISYATGYELYELEPPIGWEWEEDQEVNTVLLAQELTENL
jgi:hypothetical protein